jgi:hypothetical protein
MREYDGHLDLTARPQNLQRHIIAVSADPKIDARRTQLQFVQDDLVEEGGQARIA